LWVRAYGPGLFELLPRVLPPLAAGARMSPACTYCTGSHYLCDMPSLGPCACCTPAALTAAEQLAAERLESVEDLQDVITNHWAEWARIEGELQAIQDAFVNWLVSVGLPANPARFESPGLEAMRDAIEAAQIHRPDA